MFKENRKWSASDTLIGQGTTAEGTLSCQASLRIEGEYRGDIQCLADVIVGESGIVRSNISAKDITISGKVYGDITTTGRLTIMSTGLLQGSAAVGSLIVQDGAASAAAARWTITLLRTPISSKLPTLPSSSKLRGCRTQPSWHASKLKKQPNGRRTNLAWRMRLISRMRRHSFSASGRLEQARTLLNAKGANLPVRTESRNVARRAEIYFGNEKRPLSFDSFKEMGTFLAQKISWNPVHKGRQRPYLHQIRCAPYFNGHRGLLFP